MRFHEKHVKLAGLRSPNNRSTTPLTIACSSVVFLLPAPRRDGPPAISRQRVSLVLLCTNGAEARGKIGERSQYPGEPSFPTLLDGAPATSAESGPQGPTANQEIAPAGGSDPSAVPSTSGLSSAPHAEGRVTTKRVRFPLTACVIVGLTVALLSLHFSVA